jgi:UDP-glucose 4-epimerase
MAILITGGAGYIGSHMVHELADRGEQPVVIDDFSSASNGQYHPEFRFSLRTSGISGELRR